MHKVWSMQRADLYDFSLPFCCRPILIGTSSVQESELIEAAILEFASDNYITQKNYVQILNAKPDRVRF